MVRGCASKIYGPGQRLKEKTNRGFHAGSLGQAGALCLPQSATGVVRQECDSPSFQTPTIVEGNQMVIWLALSSSPIGLGLDAVSNCTVQ